VFFFSSQIGVYNVFSDKIKKEIDLKGKVFMRGKIV